MIVPYIVLQTVSLLDHSSYDAMLTERQGVWLHDLLLVIAGGGPKPIQKNRHCIDTMIVGKRRVGCMQ